MNDLYAEAGVKRKDTAATMGLKALMILGVLAGLFFIFIGQIFTFVGIGILIAIFFLFPSLDIEYEYVFVDGQIDFDRITGKSRRKTILRIDFDQVEIMAPLNSPVLDSYNHMQLEKKIFLHLVRIANLMLSLLM